MEVRVDRATCDYVSARGGVLWVRSTRRRCCTGSTTRLRATWTRPKDPEAYVPLDCASPISIRFCAATGQPDVLEVALLGLVHRRPVALWDGCAVKL